MHVSSFTHITQTMLRDQPQGLPTLDLPKNTDVSCTIIFLKIILLLIDRILYISISYIFYVYILLYFIFTGSH